MDDLIIDRSAAERVLDDGDLHAWGSTQRVFVSSLIDGYALPRDAAARAIEEIGAQPVMFERFGGRDGDPNQAYLNEVASSSVYVGILGESYGKPLPSRFSATHEEYRHAEQEGLRLTVWAEEGVSREGPQESFLDEVRTFNVTGSFESPEQLKAGLGERLRRIAAEDLSPWCKLGRIIFRAKAVSVAGQRATIETLVRDADVAETINELSEGLGRQRTTFAYWAGIYDAEVTAVSTVSRAAQAQEMTIELQVGQPNSPTVYGMNGMSWDEMTEIAVRVSWFGESHQAAEGLMSGFAEINNPLAQLALAGVPDESVRAIARIMANEVLVRERGIKGLREFQLGPAVAGKRRLKLGWQPAQQYVNQPPPPRVELEGEVALH